MTTFKTWNGIKWNRSWGHDAGRPFLPSRRFSDELVIAMGLGHLTYPFEARPGYFEDVTPMLQPLLTALLSRDPKKRPTIDQVGTVVVGITPRCPVNFSGEMEDRNFSNKV